MRGARGHPEVRVAIIAFARWLRGQYEFPIRVPVYLLPGEQVKTCDGQLVSASFFGPYDRTVEPYIRIATGEYSRIEVEYGRDGAIGCHLMSLAHEIVHYRQWIETGDFWEAGVVRRAETIMRRYGWVRGDDDDGGSERRVSRARRRGRAIRAAASRR